MEPSRKTETLNGGGGGTSGSGIRDNYLRGAVGEFLRVKIREGSCLSVVSAYFTIYAFGALQKELAEIDHMRFLFGEPRFIQSLDPERTDKKSFKIEDEGLQLTNRLQQKRLARLIPSCTTADSEELRALPLPNSVSAILLQVR